MRVERLIPKCILTCKCKDDSKKDDDDDYTETVLYSRKSQRLTPNSRICRGITSHTYRARRYSPRAKRNLNRFKKYIVTINRKKRK